MDYYISRAGQQYGPYSLLELRKYMAQGSISLADFARTGNMTTWMPLSQLLPELVPPPAAPQPPVYGQPYPGAPLSLFQQPQMASPGGPVPPSLHWALVLLFTILSCGVFWFVWIFIQSSFIKKIRPDSEVTTLYVIYAVLSFGGGILAGVLSVLDEPGGEALGRVAELAGFVVFIVAKFKARRLLEEYYNSVEPIGLWLSGVMTFFFDTFYFQYHFTRIADWKRTGFLRPQG